MSIQPFVFCRPFEARWLIFVVWTNLESSYFDRMYRDKTMPKQHAAWIYLECQTLEFPPLPKLSKCCLQVIEDWFDLIGSSGANNVECVNQVILFIELVADPVELPRIQSYFFIMHIPESIKSKADFNISHTWRLIYWLDNDHVAAVKRYFVTSHSWKYQTERGFQHSSCFKPCLFTWTFQLTTKQKLSILFSQHGILHKRDVTILQNKYKNKYKEDFNILCPKSLW